jgi:serine/threonine protein phosphatase PrpC
MRPEIDFAGREIQGRRDRQEDFYAFEVLGEDRLLLVLADGVGGQAAGELASRAAVTGFMDGFAASTLPEPQRFSAALALANRRIAEAIDEHPEKRSTMATTLLAVLVAGPALHWISVGDSPLLLFREGKLQRLNQDQSGAGQEAELHLPRNLLLSALVGGRLPRVDWPKAEWPLQKGDLLLAASDGLWTLSLEEIGDYLSGHREEKAAFLASGLLRRVEKIGKPNQDNVTIALIKAAG